MYQLEILQVSGIGIGLSVFVRIQQIILLIVQTVGIIRINVIGRKKTGFKIPELDAFGVHGRLVFIIMRLIGMTERIGRDPVGKRQRRLKLILLRFMRDQSVARPAQKRFKGCGALGVKVIAVIIAHIRMLVVGVEDKVGVPFDPDDPARQPS